jgi:hypothetical protein
MAKNAFDVTQISRNREILIAGLAEEASSVSG